MEKSGERLSRLLSQVLRHKASKLGLYVRSDGFIPLNDVLALKDFKKLNADLSAVEQVVATNNKQRFKLQMEDGVAWIRANQGHSIEGVSSDELLQPIINPSPFAVCIHGAYKKDWASIKRSGLSRMSRNHIHMSSQHYGSKNIISGMRKSSELLIHIDMAAASKAGIKFYKSDNDVILSEGNSFGMIPTDFFSKVVEAKTGKVIHESSSLAALGGSAPTAFCSHVDCSRYATKHCGACKQDFCFSCDSSSSLHTCPSDAPRSLLPPIAEQRPHLVTFGVAEGENRGGSNLFKQPRLKNDPWFWLRDDDRKNPEVLDHLKAENAYTAQQTAHLDEFRQKLYQEHISHLKETDDDPAFSDGPFFYYTKTIKGLSYKIHCRKQKVDVKARLPTEDLSEIVVLDENQIAEGHPQCSISGVRPSPDHGLLSYSVDFNGSEDFEVRFKKLDNSGELPDRLERVEAGSAIFGTHAQSVFYVTRDETKRPYKLWHHKLGTVQADDTCLFTEEDEMFNLDCYKSASGRYLFAETSSKETSEAWYLDLSSFSESSKLSVIQPRTFGLRYEVEHLAGESLLIITNKDDNPNNRLMTAKFGACSQEHWIDLIPYDETRWIEDFRVFSGHVALAGRQGGISRLWLLDVHADSDSVKVSGLRRLEFPEDLYEVSISVNREFHSPYLRLTYSSLITPPTWYDYEMDKTSKKPLLLVKQVEILEYDKTRYECSQLHAKSFDGTIIPMSMVRLKAETEDSKSEPGPLLLYGYGSYGLCMDPGFDRTLLPYLDRGVTYVIAHIRGGGEMGRAWYEQHGKYLTKRNTFLDFISCAEHLISTGVTSSDLLAIEGRSAGGLLVGAVVNMRPDLFRVAVAGVPFVDVMTTMCDASIPLTTAEWEEWGNPNDPKFYDYMLSYSPIDQVRAQPYPTILITTGLHDPRVAYWEPAKWTSKLRTVKAAHMFPARTGKVTLGEVLMKIDLETGHFSASDRYRKLREKSFEMSVVLDCLGLVD